MSDNNVVKFPTRSEPTDPVLGYLQEIEGLLEDAQQLTQKGVVSTMDEHGEGAVAMAHSKITDALIFVECWISEEKHRLGVKQ
ncbi:hypothetical protein ACK33W_02485 [Aeromonas veronii]